MTFKMASISTDLPEGQSLDGDDAKYIPAAYVALIVMLAGVSKKLIKYHFNTDDPFLYVYIDDLFFWCIQDLIL
jgi:hypothetical protein